MDNGHEQIGKSPPLARVGWQTMHSMEGITPSSAGCRKEFQTVAYSLSDLSQGRRDTSSRESILPD